MLVPQLRELSPVVFNKHALRTIVLWQANSHIDLAAPSDLHLGYPVCFHSEIHAAHWRFQAGGGGLDDQAKAQVQATIQQSLQQALASINWTKIITRAMPQNAQPIATQDAHMQPAAAGREQDNEQPSGRRKRKRGGGKAGQAKGEQPDAGNQQGGKGTQGKSGSNQIKGAKGGAAVSRPGTVPSPSKPPKSNSKGKGQGGDEGGWTKVQKKGQESNTPFELRAQDWSSPLVSFSNFARQLDELASGAIMKAVVIEIASIHSMLRGTAKPYQVLTVFLSKREDAQCIRESRRSLGFQTSSCH